MSGSPPVASMSCSAFSLLAFKRAWTSAQATVGCPGACGSRTAFSASGQGHHVVLFSCLLLATAPSAPGWWLVASSAGPNDDAWHVLRRPFLGASAVACRTRVGWHRRHGFTPPGRCGGGQAAVSPPHGVGVSSCPSCQLLGRGHGQAEGPLTRFYSSNALPQAGSADRILFRNASDRACTTGS